MIDAHSFATGSPSTDEDRWSYLYRAAAIAALISVALFMFQIVAFFV